MMRFNQGQTGTSRWIVLVLAVLLAVSVAACGGGEQAPEEEGSDADDQEQTAATDDEPSEPAADEGDDGGDAEETSGDEADVDIDNVFTGTSLQDLIQYFAVLDYTWTAVGNVEGVAEEATFGARYELAGSETIDGTEAQKVNIEMRSAEGDEESFTFWLDSDGKAVQVEAGGMTMSGEQGQMMADSMLIMAFMPFHMMSTFDYQAALEEDDTWEIAGHSQEQASLGGHDATMHTLTVDQTAAGGATYEWRYADFGGFQMFIDWSATIEGATQGFEMTINELQRR